MTEPQFKRMKERFAVSIRKESLNQKFKTLRAQYFDVIPERYPLNVLIKLFDLDTHEQFAQENIYKDPFSLVNILLAKRQNIIRVSFKNSLSNEIIDEKLVPPENSESENENVPLPKQYPFHLQIALFQMIVEDTDERRQIDGNQKYKLMDKQLQFQLVDFFLAYLKRNKYIEVAKEKDLLIMLLTLMEVFLSFVDSKDLKKHIIKWASGTDSLSLLSSCISPSDSMTYPEHPRLYQLILKGLQHVKKDVQFNAINLLLLVIYNLDYDEMVKVQQQVPQIFNELINFFQKMDQQNNAELFNQDKNLFQAVKEAAKCVLCFLESYDEEVLKFMQGGAGYVGAWLIMQKQQELITRGLTIFKCIADVQDREYANEAVSFLISNPSIQQTFVWQRLGQSYEIVYHKSQNVIQAFVEFVKRVICNTELTVIHNMNVFFCYPNGESLVDILVSLFVECEDMTTRYCILQCFQAICFYADPISSQLQSEKDEFEKLPYRSLQVKVVISKIMNSQMSKVMKIMQEKEQEIGSSFSKYDSIGSLIGEFFDFIDENIEKLNMERDQEI